MRTPTSTSLHDLLHRDRAGSQVVVALEPFALPEAVDFALGALRAVAPDTVVVGAATATSWPASPAIVKRTLEDAGLHGVRVQTTSWETRIRSAEELLALVRAVPAVAAAFRNVTDEQHRRVRRVLDGMLRERSGGAPDAVMHAEVCVITGTT